MTVAKIRALTLLGRNSGNVPLLDVGNYVIHDCHCLAYSSSVKRWAWGRWEPCWTGMCMILVGLDCNTMWRLGSITSCMYYSSELP